MSFYSRRHVLAAASAAAASTGPLAWAQGATRIERLAPELDAIIDISQPVRRLGEGFGGDIGPTEGPVWWKEGGYLLFSDIHNDRRMRYTPGRGITVDQQGVNRHNGLTRDRQGRLVMCERDGRRVVRREADGSTTVISNAFQAKRLNRPNDVVVKSDGSIYFSDPGNPSAPTPGSAPPPPEPWDVPFAGLYRVSADLGFTSLLADDLTVPNGLAFSPDEKLLYVSDTGRRVILSFELSPNGMLMMQSRKVFADLNGREPGVPDGMKVDTAGNVYSGGPGGLWIFNAQGKPLGRIVHGETTTTNIAFGGEDWRTLYFTSRTHLGAVQLKLAGTPVPVSGR